MKHRQVKYRQTFIVTLALTALSLGGCESVSTLMGGKSAPDEFTVYSRAPLSIPPEFKLQPPAPGAARPQEVEPRESAEQVVFNTGAPQGDSARGGQVAARQKLSTGENALIKETGGDQTDPGIRAIVNREAIVPIESSKTLANKILFWRDPRKRVNIVDPVKENKRIREMKAKGEPISGEGVPIINRDLDRSFFDKMFFD